MDKIRERFFAKTKLSESPKPGMGTPCLEWAARCGRGGYGYFWDGTRGARAHRTAWKLEHGDYPPQEIFVCHRCDNPSCVRVDHLFLGTVATNNADMLAKGRDAKGDRNGARLHPEKLPRGEAHGSAKLTESDIRMVFKMKREGEYQCDIAKNFGVSPQLVSDIIRRKVWAHISI